MDITISKPQIANAPDLDALRRAAGSACRMLKVLANPDRLLLLCRIAQAEACVGELEHDLGIGQPTLSQQLGVLRDEALVATRREGKRIHYSIASPQALAILTALHDQFCSSDSTSQPETLS